MPNHLVDAISPYLRSHAENPVHWHSWGIEAFVEAKKRDLPVLVSIGYSTCHWCHVMARESFSDPDIADYLNEHFVSIKVDREEHPDVDASYLAAASAFVQGLGWPLNVFVTPDGQAFHAGTYFPPVGQPGHPSFRDVLSAVTDAWLTRREEVTAGAARVAEVLAESARQLAAGSESVGGDGSADDARPSAEELDHAVAELVGFEDTLFGGFGGAPKFPASPTLSFLLGHGRVSRRDTEDAPEPDTAPSSAAPSDGTDLALRTLKIMGASPLRDPIEGGFFRYAVNRDWSDPHYERMLYDNAQLLGLYTRAWMLTGGTWARHVAEGVAGFLTDVMQLPSGGFASAQDSESTVDGVRVEGGYYALEASERQKQIPPALDEKVLTGWNGLAIQALARAGFVFDRPDLISAARRAAEYLHEQHERADGTLVRASVAGVDAARVQAHRTARDGAAADDIAADATAAGRATFGRTSAAKATLEDYGMYSRGLLELALVTGDVTYASRARRLLDSTISNAPSAAESSQSATRAGASGTHQSVIFRPPHGADPVLRAQGLVSAVDPSEGAYPSGLSSSADAAVLLYRLTGDDRYRRAAQAGLSLVASLAPKQPLAFGAALHLFDELSTAIEQLVIVSPDRSDENQQTVTLQTVTPHPVTLSDLARRHPAHVVASVSETQARAFAAAGFALFDHRAAPSGLPTAYLCRDFVCQLPVTGPGELPLPAAMTDLIARIVAERQHPDSAPTH
ncbi:thioredoxin domain-containing protein [Cryobacterium sp. Y29]|uniref:thioredoxin domain-containing protein n=1 Tax=Cryobacterium sp. Y29 TaxID=2048285 RepID=UPI000CE3750C|nr:thioredoxin domain-containing protein [Cryobacterium sp. Y29]